MGLEDLSGDQIMMILKQLEIFAYIFLAIFILHLLARIVPAYLQYRSVKYLEIKIITKEQKKDKQQPTLIMSLLKEKIRKWRNKEDIEIFSK